MRTVLLIRHGAVVERRRSSLHRRDRLADERGGRGADPQSRRAAARALRDPGRSTAAISSARGGRRNCSADGARHADPCPPRLARGRHGRVGGGLAAATSPERNRTHTRQRGRDIAGYRPPGGESFSDLAARVLPCWRRHDRRQRTRRRRRRRPLRRQPRHPLRHARHAARQPVPHRPAAGLRERDRMPRRRPLVRLLDAVEL